MAYIVSSVAYNEVANGPGGTSHTLTMPPHRAGDVLYALLSSYSSELDFNPTGWILVGSLYYGIWGRYYRVATTDNESMVVTLRANVRLGYIVYTLRGVDTSNPIDAAVSSTANFIPITSTSSAITTTANGSLIIYETAHNNYTYYPKVGSANEGAATYGGNNHIVTSYKIAPVAGSIPAFPIDNLQGSSSGLGIRSAVAFRDNGAQQNSIDTTERPAIIRNYLTPPTTTNKFPQNNFAWFTGVGGVSVSTSAVNLQSFQVVSGALTSAAGEWVGMWDDLTTPINLSNGNLVYQWAGINMAQRVGPLGAILVLADSSGAWKAFTIALNIGSFDVLIRKQSIIHPLNTPAFATSGSVDLTNTRYIGIFYHRNSSDTSQNGVGYYSINYFPTPIVITGGSTEIPVSMSSINNGIRHYLDNLMAVKQGYGQLLLSCPIRIGNGSTKTICDFSGTSLESSLPYHAVSNNTIRIFDNAMNIDIYGGNNDTIWIRNTTLVANIVSNFTINPLSSTTAAYLFSGATFINWKVIWKTGVPCDKAIFSKCPEIDGKAATFSNCIISAATETHALALDAGGSVAGTAFTKGSDTYALKLREAGTYNLQGTTFSGYTTPIKITATTGTVTLTLNSGQTQPTYSSDGATVVYDQPLQECGLTINDLVAGSQVVVFEAGTQNELERDDNTGTTFEWSVFAASEEVDYTIQKAGYLPQRFAGLTLTSVQVSDANQQIDRAYVASSGLSYGTTATFTVGAGLFDLTTASTVQNYYSFMIESWIAQSSLANVPFRIVPNGPNSFSLTGGCEFTATSLPYLSRDGLRYVSTGGTQTAVWAALLSVGTSAGMQVRYQQSDGGTTGEAATTGPIDELIQIYGDSTHGNFDYRGYLKLKVQADGYDEANADAIATYGNLEDQLYIVGLAPLSNGLATGDPSVTGVTITDHGASPVTWNSKSWSTTITDSGTNSGTAIMRWLRYNFAQGGTFQSKDAFNWHDLVQVNGTKFKTVRGPIYGDTGAALKGVRVIRGTDPHPDFDLMTADDGTTYAPPPTASVTITGAVTGSRVQLYDMDANEELLNSATAPFVWSETYSADREIRLRVMQADADSAKLFIDTIIGTITESSPTISYLVDQDDDAVYAANAIDGSGVTGITIDDDNLLINIDDDALTWATIYAYETYWLTTEEGIRDEGRIIDATDTANYRFHGFKIKNIGTGPLVITGGYGIDAATNTVAALFDTSGQSIFPAPDHVVAYQLDGGEVEPGISQQAAMRVLLSVAAGKTTITDLGGGSAEVVFRDIGDTTDRVTATMAGSERSSVTLDTN